MLGLALRADPGSQRFYLGTLALAAVWVAGALASGPLPWGRPSVAAPLIGLGLAGAFVVGGLAVRAVEPLDEQVGSVLDFADQGSLPVVLAVTAVNGVAEELFFRGAAYDAIPRHPVVWTALANTAVVAASGNPMLAFAALVLGVVVGVQRRATGGIAAPVVVHVTWSVTLLLALPAVFG